MFRLACICLALLAAYPVWAAEQPGLASSYLPADASFALMVRPAELAQDPLFGPLLKVIDSWLKPAGLEIPLAEVEEFKFVMIGVTGLTDGNVSMYMSVRARQRYDWRKLYEADGKLKTMRLEGNEVLLTDDDEDNPCCVWLPDDRTVVYGTNAAVTRTFGNDDPNDRAEWAEAWTEMSKKPLAILGRPMLIPEVFPIGDEEEWSLVLAREASVILVTGQLTRDGLAIETEIVSHSEDGAAEIAQELGPGLVKLTSELLQAMEFEAEVNEPLIDALFWMLKQKHIEVREQTVHVDALMTPKLLEAITAAMKSME